MLGFHILMSGYTFAQRNKLLILDFPLLAVQCILQTYVTQMPRDSGSQT